MLESVDIPRVIPCLLIDNHRLVKTLKFRQPKYVGDPVNAVRIFNDKEVDEILILDIAAARTRRPPNFDYVHELASECFMPMAYGGGISSVDDANRLFALGVEKVSLNTAAADDLQLINQLAAKFGSQSIVASIDVKKRILGGRIILTAGGQVRCKLTLSDHVRRLVEAGAGEILINSIDRDGTMKGYDLELINSVAAAVNVPVIASGGAGSVTHFRDAVHNAGASAVAAGAFFVFSGPHRAVLITYPERKRLVETFNGVNIDDRQPA